MDNTELKTELLNIAYKSGLYTSTGLRQWTSHIDYCVRHGQVEYLLKHGKLVGFATWYLTNNPLDGQMYGFGRYCIISTLYILPEYRKLCSVKRLLFQGVNNHAYRLAMNGVDYILWKRFDPDGIMNYEKRNTYWLGLRRTRGGWKCTKLYL